MTFDPFGDFATCGYLRNVAKAKYPEIVQRLLHNSFLTGIDAALDHLKARSSLGYVDVLRTHKTLFEAVFPVGWRGSPNERVPYLCEEGRRHLRPPQ